jgi:hypothetical protein
MRPDSLRLGTPLRRWLYAAGGTLFVSGICWLALDWWGQRQTEFGVEPNPAAPWVLRAHGAAAMLVLLVFGAMIPLHLRRGWRARANRRSGAIIAASCALLVLSGYGLYYAGGEQLRLVAVVAHDGLGCAVPLILFWHVRRGRAARLRAAPPVPTATGDGPGKSGSPAPGSGS